MGFLRDLHLNQSPEKWDLSKGSEITHLAVKKKKRQIKKGCVNIYVALICQVYLFLFTHRHHLYEDIAYTMALKLD